METKVDERVKRLKQKMKNSFQAPTDVNLSRSTRQTRLTITFVGDQTKTEEDLEKILGLIKKA